MSGSTLYIKGNSSVYGVGIGIIYILTNESNKFGHNKIKSSEVKNQLNNLHKAFILTKEELSKLYKEIMGYFNKDAGSIIDIYNAILDDKIFIKEIEDRILLDRYTAESAIEISFEKYISEIEICSDDYLKQRIFDLNDIKARIIKNVLGGWEPSLDKIYHKHIVVVDEITPTLALILGKKRVMGIVAGNGGSYFSHTAIILRGIGIPLINNINQIDILRFENSPAIIDGMEGLLIVNPDNSEINNYREILKTNILKQKLLNRKRKNKTVTRDGKMVRVYSNVGNIEDCECARDKNVDGIGLVRTEILFAMDRNIPDEKEQLSVYSKIVKRFSNSPVVFRTFDFGSDKLPKFSLWNNREADKSLRGIKRSLHFREEFKVQLKSIIQASQLGKVRITFPMINNVNEIKEAKRIISQIYNEKTKLGEKLPKIKIGAFIETNDALKNLDAILKEVSFINIGTNDLFQQTMGSDRLKTNTIEYLEPKFLKILKLCISKAKSKNRHVIICGEMSGDPLAVVILVGMGAYEFSLSPSKTDEFRSGISNLSLNEAKIIAKKALKCSSAVGVREILSKWILKVGSEDNV